MTIEKKQEIRKIARWKMVLLFFDVQYFISTSHRICVIFLAGAPDRWRKNGNFAFVTFSIGFSRIQILIIRILKSQIIYTYTICRFFFFSKLLFNSDIEHDSEIATTSNWKRIEIREYAYRPVATPSVGGRYVEGWNIINPEFASVTEANGQLPG